MSGEVAQGGVVAVLWFMAVLSINLGLINLFPVPVLDGGHLLFYAAEAIRGKPLGQRAQEYGFRIGLALVLTLMVFATWNDLVHLGIVEFVQGPCDLRRSSRSGGWSLEAGVGVSCVACPFDCRAGAAAGLALVLSLARQRRRCDAGCRPARLRGAIARSDGRRHGRRHPDRGTQRIEPETVRSYLLIQPGDPWDDERVDSSLKALFATGLFADVNLSREGNTLVVKVVENPIINRIAFEGNSKLDDKDLNAEIQLRPRVVYTRTRVQNDVKRILDLYRRHGRFAATVEPKSSSSRKTGSISSSRSTRASSPASAASISSAITVSATASCAASSRPRKAAGIAFCQRRHLRSRSPDL